MKINYSYHDDPFLQPLKRIDYRTYALSYEAGKKAAMWIHKEHRDLFPKHLSEPEIEVNAIYIIIAQCTLESNA